MARLHLVHWDAPEGRRHQRALEALGHEVVYLDELTGTPLLRALRAGGVDLIVLDLSRRPSHAREIAMSLRSRTATRHIPLLFVDGEPEKVAAIRAVLPDAAYTTWGRMRTAIPAAIRHGAGRAVRAARCALRGTHAGPEAGHRRRGTGRGRGGAARVRGHAGRAAGQGAR